MSVRLCTIAVIALLAPLAHAQPRSPVALVEEIQGHPADVETMDYLVAGRVIKLGPGDMIVLGYLKSCWRETIMGGTVTVGVEQSDVQGGNVGREKIPCDAGRMHLTAETASKGGATVYREMPTTQPPSLLQLRPQFRLYGTSPVVMMAPGSSAVIERVDRPGERYQIVAGNGPHASYDFADHSQSLVVGGVYRATQGKTRVLFQIHLDAKPGKTPLLGRLIELKSRT